MDYDLYAVDASELNDAVSLVARILELQFTEHESSYVGTYFRADGEGDETFKLRENLDPIDNKPCEAAYTKIRFLLYVDGSRRGDDLRSMIQAHPMIELLRHEHI